MKIRVGSKNPNKIEAVKNIFLQHFGDGIDVTGVDVSSDISDQPFSMEETIRGAMNRARNAFSDCDVSIGIEGGLMEVPYSHSGYMQFEACVLFDGTHSYLGLTGAFGIPKHVIETIKSEATNLSVAFKKHGHTQSDYVGHDEGVIGVFTKGKIKRKEYTEHAVEMMLAHYNNKEIFTFL